MLNEFDMDDVNNIYFAHFFVIFNFFLDNTESLVFIYLFIYFNSTEQINTSALKLTN